MKRFRFLTLFALGTALMIAVGCTPGSNGEDIIAKPVDGVAPVFDDGASRYSVAPSVMQTDEQTRYVYYTANRTPDEADSAVMVRKATLQNGVWTYGERKTLLEPSETGWDSVAVSDPSVICGSFGYDGQTYSYLMAYQGRSGYQDRNYGIGFAVGNAPDGEFLRIPDCVLAYDRTLYGDAYGYGNPSLVSYDAASKFRLFYTAGDPAGTAEYFVELDGADLGSLAIPAEQAVTVRGLTEIDPSAAPTFRDADFALDGDTLIAVRNRYPAGEIPALPTAVQVVGMPVSNLYTVAAGTQWTVIAAEIASFDLSDYENDRTGWQRIYSPALVRDAYGRLCGDGIGLYLTVTAFDADGTYLHYQTIVETNVIYNGLEAIS